MIYFDNAATTCVFPEVVEAMQDAMQVTYGNPSAKHMKGIEAENKVKVAQEFHGLFSAGMIGFSFLMLLNCFVYAIAWQKVIKKFDLNVAYANRTVYLIWSQIWAVFIFHESLTVTNMIGLLVVFIGVLVVQKYE